MRAVGVIVGVVYYPEPEGCGVGEQNTILAIDLGRYKGVACDYDRATRGHTFRR